MTEQQNLFQMPKRWAWAKLREVSEKIVDGSYNPPPKQEKTCRKFTVKQEEWPNMIKGHIATSLAIDIEDFENVPFNQKGGAYKAYEIFGTELVSILQGMNEALVA